MGLFITKNIYFNVYVQNSEGAWIRLPTLVLLPRAPSPGVCAPGPPPERERERKLEPVHKAYANVCWSQSQSFFCLFQFMCRVSKRSEDESHKVDDPLCSDCSVHIDIDERK